MTVTDAPPTMTEEAVALIDQGLKDMQHRELASTDEVSDLLLDIRRTLTREDA